MPAPALSPRFPLPGAVRVQGADYAPETVLRVLGPYLTDARRERLANVIAQRTFSVLPVLERLHDPGNVNAVVRSAEGLGCGAVALVDLQGDAAEREGTRDEDERVADKRARARVSQGAHKWTEATEHADARAFAAWARGRGYRIAVTALRDDAMPIAMWDFSQPTALVVGAEMEGASDAMIEEADAALLLPIDGFVQSYNVSVAAALALYHARADRLARLGHHGDLTEPERRLLLAHYTARAVPLADPLLRRDAGAQNAQAQKK